MDGATRRILLGLVALAAVVAAAAFAREAAGVDVDPVSIRAFVDGFGLWGPFVLIAMIGLRPVLLIPSQVLLVAAGICFGTVAGALYAAVGLMFGGLTGFAFARWVGRDVVLARIPPGLRGLVEGRGQVAGLAFLFVATAYPVGPIFVYAMAAALAGMTLVGVAAALFAGGFVRAAAFTFFGSSLVEADSTRMALAALALGVVLLVPLLHPRARAWALRVLRER